MDPSPSRPAGLRWSLSAKLATGLVLGAIGFFALFGYAQERLQRRQLESMVRLSADRITDIIRSSAWDHMMANDRQALYGLIRNIGRERGIRVLRIMNDVGEIQHSSDASEVGRFVDRQAEACVGCHSGPTPLYRLERQNRTRIFTRPGSGRILAAILPIENHQDCSSAPCHAHPASRRILGVIDVQLALDDVDAQLAASRRQLVYSMAAGTALLAAIGAGFVWRVVHRPMRQFARGTRQLARGDLGFRIPVESDDELGDLARSFNQMTVALAAARKDLSHWAQTLESRVAEKTAALEQAHRGLLRSEKMASLGRLAATVAHEVNNPLFGMLTYARLCRKEIAKLDLPEPQAGRLRENLEVIERESQRCGDLMKSLLAFSRHSPLHRAPFAIGEVVERALQLMRHPYELAGIELRTEVAPGLPPLDGDAGQIQQVLVALLANARDALGHGGRVTVRAEAAEGGVRLAVADTGPGVPEELQASIFEPFFSTKDHQHRTGLGLAIAKDIVERHGGVIQVVSEPGQGAEFQIFLPGQGPGGEVAAEAACLKVES